MPLLTDPELQGLRLQGEDYQPFAGETILIGFIKTVLLAC